LPPPPPLPLLLLLLLPPPSLVPAKEECDALSVRAGSEGIPAAPAASSSPSLAAPAVTTVVEGEAVRPTGPVASAHSPQPE
jgi:hypothetical protein